MQESLIPGVMVGKTEGPTKVGGYSETEMTLVCLHCSEEKKANIMTTCPHCLSGMKQDCFLGRREEYFGCSHLYFGILLSYCPACGFKVASDEWNQ